MSKTPHTPVPDETTQTKIWIRNELLEFVDRIALRDDRSRAYVVNQAIAAWKVKLDSQRIRRAKKKA